MVYSPNGTQKDFVRFIREIIDRLCYKQVCLAKYVPVSDRNLMVDEVLMMQPSLYALVYASEPKQEPIYEIGPITPSHSEIIAEPPAGKPGQGAKL